jgi:hypothetical protein
LAPTSLIPELHKLGVFWIGNRLAELARGVVDSAVSQAILLACETAAQA